MIDEASADKSKPVQGGSNVTVKGKDGKSHKYQVVGPTEADPSQGRISHKSPIRRALLGKKRGDPITFQTPRGEIEFTLTSLPSLGLQSTHPGTAGTRLSSAPPASPPHMATGTPT